MLDYCLCATQILQAIGGAANIDVYSVCASRLRIKVMIQEFVNLTELEVIDGVKGVYRSLGFYNLIIGYPHAKKVYDELKLQILIERHSNSALVSTGKKQPEPVIVNNYYNPTVQINIENLNISGLTFNQIIQYNKGNQQTINVITDRIALYTNFVTYITQRDQKNDAMARDVIDLLKANPDIDVRSLGYSMQAESEVGRNPLAKLRKWILQHKDDVNMAKKILGALSSAAIFAKKWGPWLAKAVGL